MPKKKLSNKPSQSQITTALIYLKDKRRNLKRQLDVVGMQLDVLEGRLKISPGDDLMTEAAEEASIVQDWMNGGSSRPPSLEEILTA